MKKLRRAVPDDADAVAGCVTHAFSHYVDRIGRKPGPMLMNYADEIREYQVFVVEEDDKVVGVLVLCVNDEGFLLDVRTIALADGV